jgi:4,5-DOPA dioxygenase extradiol
MQYPAPGAPALAEQAADLLAQAGFSPQLDPEHGFDHGAWTPLKLMRPEADIPIVAMSIDLRQSPQWHFNAGRALAPLREEGVAIIGSGSMTHNLRAFFTKQRPPGISGNEWVEQFRDWVKEKAEAGEIEDLLNYRRLAPFARENHPTEDHFLPFFVALGAGAGNVGKRIHASVDHDILAMDAFTFS